MKNDLIEAILPKLKAESEKARDDKNTLWSGRLRLWWFGFDCPSININYFKNFKA